MVTGASSKWARTARLQSHSAGTAEVRQAQRDASRMVGPWSMGRFMGYMVINIVRCIKTYLGMSQNRGPQILVFRNLEFSFGAPLF